MRVKGGFRVAYDLFKEGSILAAIVVLILTELGFQAIIDSILDKRHNCTANRHQTSVISAPVGHMFCVGCSRQDRVPYAWGMTQTRYEIYVRTRFHPVEQFARREQDRAARFLTVLDRLNRGDD